MSRLVKPLGRSLCKAKSESNKSLVCFGTFSRVSILSSAN